MPYFEMQKPGVKKVILPTTHGVTSGAAEKCDSEERKEGEALSELIDQTNNASQVAK